MSTPSLTFAPPPRTESSRRAVLQRTGYMSADAPIRRCPESPSPHGFPPAQWWLKVQNRLGSGLCSYIIIDVVGRRKADLKVHSCLLSPAFCLLASFLPCANLRAYSPHRRYAGPGERGLHISNIPLQGRRFDR